MRGLLHRFVLLALLLTMANAHAGNVTVDHAWARATAPGQDVASVDLSINSKASASLTGVTSSACRTIELHRMTHDDGMMKMRQVESIELNPGKTLNLSDAGYHLMLIGLNAPLKAGQQLPLTLTITQKNGQAEQLSVTVEVKGLTEHGGATSGNSREHHH